MKWNEEAIQILRELTEQGWTSKQISEEFGWSLDSIKAYKSKYKIKSSPDNKKLGGRTTEYTKEILIDKLVNSDIITQEYFNDPKNNLPNPSTYRKFFGSWSNALLEAGLPLNMCVMDPTKQTRVYLVEFDDGFYKVGITQRTINQRLCGYPKYTVILDILMPYDEALATEKRWLDVVREFKFVPSNFPKNSGVTECFKY